MHQKTIPWLDRRSEGFLWLVAKRGVCNLSLLHPVKQDLYSLLQRPLFSIQLKVLWFLTACLSRTKSSPPWLIHSSWLIMLCSNSEFAIMQTHLAEVLYILPQLFLDVRAAESGSWDIKHMKRTLGRKVVKDIFLKKIYAQQMNLCMWLFIKRQQSFRPKLAILRGEVLQV